MGNKLKIVEIIPKFNLVEKESIVFSDVLRWLGIFKLLLFQSFLIADLQVFISIIKFQKI